MARQSLRKRKKRYQERHQVASTRIFSLLIRQKARLDSGAFHDQLTKEELTKVRGLLFKAFRTRLDVVRGQVIHLGPLSLEERRKIFYQVSTVLRQAGNRVAKAKAKSPTKVILRGSRSSPGTRNP
jgi:hypothetical protein